MAAAAAVRSSVGLTFRLSRIIPDCTSCPLNRLRSCVGTVQNSGSFESFRTINRHLQTSIGEWCCLLTRLAAIRGWFFSRYYLFTIYINKLSFYCTFYVVVYGSKVWRAADWRIWEVLRTERVLKLLDNTCVTLRQHSQMRVMKLFVQQVKHSSHPIRSGDADIITVSRNSHISVDCLFFFFWKVVTTVRRGTPVRRTKRICKFTKGFYFEWTLISMQAVYFLSAVLLLQLRLSYIQKLPSPSQLRLYLTLRERLFNLFINLFLLSHAVLALLPHTWHMYHGHRLNQYLNLLCFIKMVL